MVFKTAFISRVSDANPEDHKAKIDTELCKLYVRLVSNQQEALQICKNLAKKMEIHSIILCPGFTHEQIAEISKEVGNNIGVSVARGDGPSSEIAREAMKKAGWFE